MVTTPCLVHASTAESVDAGVMVSASHNPAPDNGLKVVVDGRKADDAAEAELEQLIACMRIDPLSTPEKIEQLRTELGEYHRSRAFQRLETMGDILWQHIQECLTRPAAIG